MCLQARARFSTRYLTMHFRGVIARRRLGDWIVGMAILASVLLGAAQPAQAAPWVVDTLSDAANGNCSNTCTLRDAMALSASGDTITLSVSGTISLDSSLPDIGSFPGDPKTLTIDGSGHQVTLDGNGFVHIMKLANFGTLSVTALTFANGSWQGYGGAIESRGNLNVSRCTFSSNTVGAINNGTGGGAIASLSAQSVLNVSDSTFVGNNASSVSFSAYGGAIYNNGGTLNVVNSTFNSNGSYHGTFFGSAIANQSGGIVNVANSTFTNNGASSINSDGIVNIVNSTFLNNGTIVVADDGSSATLNNSLLIAATLPICSGNFSGANNLSDDSSCPGVLAAATNIYTALADNGGPTSTLAPFVGSNALDAVPNGACVYKSNGTNPLFTNGATILTDQCGSGRPDGALCDIGAFEGAAPPPPETTITAGATAYTTPGSRARVKFRFESDDPSATFECRVKQLGPAKKAGKWASCTSPYKEKLAVGRYQLLVRATDTAEHTDPTPAKRGFKIKAE
jgi:CSLREA domain-containing protein